jgi:GDPmannose 4,6-dehydratase|tara:strand:- start:8983 stop:9951 length:969 start_codon:yes stop_codon:yes gene_type:complete
MKSALVTGINGQDGSYMADLLLENDYKVFGMERRSSRENRDNTSHLVDNPNFEFVKGDLSDQNSLLRCLKIAKPSEVYNFASQSFVGESWNTPEQTSDVTGLGALRLLEAIREYDGNTRFYQASSSEMFGRMVENPATEKTPFYPRSPYGVAKLYAHWITKNYRESYDMFAVSGILFNHESERRGIEFVTRKITNGVAKIALGLSDGISLGNLDSKRDWGYAPDYVQAAWLMLQQESPDDFVIATGESFSIREFLDAAFEAVDINDWTNYVKQDPRFFRPAEVDVLRGDCTKAKTELGWTPRTPFHDWVQLMVENDIHLLQK